MSDHGKLRSKVRGCVLGAVLGDAIGSPFEFGPLTRAEALAKGWWIDGLYPHPAATGPHGVWPRPTTPSAPPPTGTGSDDTRYNWLFLELAAKLSRMPDARDLASRYLEIYEQPDSVFPGHAEWTRRQFEYWEGACRGHLGQRSKQLPDLPPDVLVARGLGFNYPVLSGLIALTSAGLLYPGRPEEAYTAAFRADFYDIGYAREAVALLAAGVSMAMAQDVPPQAVFDRLVAMDPLHLGGEFGPPFVMSHLPQALQAMAGAKSDREAAWALSVALRAYHPFDAFRALAIALVATVSAQGDPLRAILIAANHVGIDENGNLTRFEDIDCYGGIAGAIAGAMAGAEAFPAAMLDQIVESNRLVYGMDLEATIERFIERCL